MFNNLFKSAPQRQYPAIVTQIHNEFNTAGEKLLTEALAVLDDCKTKDKQKGKLLAKLGFTNTPQAKEIGDIEQKESQAKETARLVKHYADKYPFNKFINDETVKQICEKYNLVCGDVGLYKGFVPADKLQMIADFKVKHKDVPLFLIKERDGSIVAPKFNPLEDGLRCYFGTTAYKHLLEYSNKSSDYYIRTFYGDDRGHSEYAQITFDTSSLKICAPIKDMETEGYTQKGHMLVKHIPDPVVLQPVIGGYLIVCAWGDEASDDMVVNKINN